ncbi:hypothetical protein PSHT_10861 [Puccinia striiformis]|uniref:Uncharacterized protein n=1 Tax=Puccinia striiformis TaxID=27350 RepID=A0A2S4V743_9BASI|nr:hypothetical protein PSHT_10861 [Puccinia striiformis]
MKYVDKGYNSTTGQSAKEVQLTCIDVSNILGRSPPRLVPVAAYDVYPRWHTPLPSYARRTCAFDHIAHRYQLANLTKIQRKQPREHLAASITSQRAQIPVPGDRKILSIADSLVTFSQFGANDQDVTRYDRLAKALSCPLLLQVIDSRLVEKLQQTGESTRKLNDDLEQLAVLGFHAMQIFVFQNKEDLRSSTEALVNWQDDSSTETVVNLREDQDTHDLQTCSQINLTNLLLLIEITTKSNKKVSKENDQLIIALNWSLEGMGVGSEKEKYQLGELQEALAQAHKLQSASEHWRRNLKIYAMNVRSTKLIDKRGGYQRSFIQDCVKKTLEKLSEPKNLDG